MRCAKCEGLMYSQELSDFFTFVEIWRCINCGSVVDQTILENREICHAPAEEEVYSKV